MRTLFLHVSALNEDEYALFTSSFTDLLASDTPLTTDADFDKQRVSIREARAWLRGRYADLPVSELNQVRILFSCRVTYANPQNDLLDLTVFCSKPWARSRAIPGTVFRYPTPCVACSRRRRARQESRI